MKKYIAFIFALVAMTAMFSSVNFMPTRKLNALNEYKGMVVIEQNSKRVLDEYNKDQRFPMASTTKIMTALVILKNCPDLEREIAINDKAIGIEGTSMYLRKGEKLTLKELLAGMMLPSGNDAATALALSVCDTMEEFAELMNKEAKELGLENTNFKNSHGLDEDEHYTSAYDLATISAEAMKYKEFTELVVQSSMQVRGAGGDQGDIRFLKNKNKFIKLYEGATGIKTGFTDNAGRCLVASSTRGKMNLICVVLNCPTMFETAGRLMNKAYEKYNYVELLPAYNCYRKMDVQNGKETEVKLYTCRGFAYPLTQEETAEITYDYHVPSSLTAPIKKEEVIGYVEIILGETVLFKENIYTMDEIKGTNFLNNFQSILENWY